MSIVVPTTLDTLVAPVVTGAIAPAPFTRRSVVVPIVAGGGGTASPLNVWNGTAWASSGMSVVSPNYDGGTASSTYIGEPVTGGGA